MYLASRRDRTLDWPIHKVLNEFDCFPGTTKVAAIATPPEMLRLTTGERRVVLLHCLEDRLCVWHPDTLTDLSYNVVLDGQPFLQWPRTTCIWTPIVYTN